MDLGFLIPSNSRRVILGYFTSNQDAQAYVNELARELALAPQLVYRELINLENWGILISTKRGNQRVFSVNKRFIFLKPIIELFSRYNQAQHPKYETIASYDLKEMIREQKKIPVPKELVAGLQSPRRRPRAYDEDTILIRHKRVRRG